MYIGLILIDKWTTFEIFFKMQTAQNIIWLSYYSVKCYCTTWCVNCLIAFNYWNHLFLMIISIEFTNRTITRAHISDQVFQRDQLVLCLLWCDILFYTYDFGKSNRSMSLEPNKTASPRRHDQQEQNICLCSINHNNRCCFLKWLVTKKRPHYHSLLTSIELSSHSRGSCFSQYEFLHLKSLLTMANV